ncbi:MAG: glucose-6-phosphate dehydrogenase assembly protein OpcA [Verrucomicrobiota bacterium]|nr:glucose-6-phosphate dehydrogenase assembly protein OpcA [Verrucomicrobiota bacterium]
MATPITEPLSQKLVSPIDIEAELMLLWQKLAQEGKMRASLFNLIVCHHLSDRTDYVRGMVQKIVSQFPCRILFITYDSHPMHPYLKTAISVVAQQGNESGVACDQIDIGVGGALSLEPVPELILPHLIPDLPTYLLWTEDPTLPHILFLRLAELAQRVIFDSDSVKHFSAFPSIALHLHEKLHVEIADLNWARTEGWRDLLSSLFVLPERREQLKNISLVKIIYNVGPASACLYPPLQSIYLLTWLAKQLQWHLQEASPSLHFAFEGVDAKLESAEWARLHSGTIIGVHLHTKNDFLFCAERVPDQYHQVKVEISTPERCELPYIYLLGKTASGQSLVKEITTRTTSAHFLSVLRTLKSEFSGFLQKLR